MVFLAPNVGVHVYHMLYYCNTCSITGGELFDDIVAREFYSEKDAR